MEVHTQLRKKFSSAIKKSCNKLGCKLKLDSLSSHQITIIDADKYREISSYEGKFCDYFLFLTTATLIIAVVEMKSGGVDAKVAVEQIVNGARESERIVESQDVSNFYPIILSGSIKHASELKILGRAKIRFQGKDYPVIWKRCGTQLRDIMRTYA